MGYGIGHVQEDEERHVTMGREPGEERVDVVMGRLAGEGVADVATEPFSYSSNPGGGS